ncbi:hypothetical protein R3I93_014267 [Phoxinus phoxinus]|uniref:Uncharacterized protein n=1 Tax=Phoxinus phoxinus TaxID=58324 RepID=A0AAN9CNU5_9TELE
MLMDTCLKTHQNSCVKVCCELQLKLLIAADDRSELFFKCCRETRCCCIVRREKNPTKGRSAFPRSDGRAPVKSGLTYSRE